MTAPRCSIVIPVHNQAALTRKCLDALMENRPGVAFETIVVDDASTDSTPELLRGYGDALRTITREQNGGFAVASNEGARAAGGEYVVFLNNDTIPLAGWLDALASYADRNPRAAVVGAKLLFPNQTVQHAGVVVCQDGLPRHIYVGFPADHPAVSKSRRFQIVTAACALIRREPFEEAGGFDEAFRNSLEDADLCLRLGERGHEIHLCHESVLYHLESVSRGKCSDETEHNLRLFRERWAGRAERDDLAYYEQDGLLRIHYPDTYPLKIEVSPRVATIQSEGRQEESERLLDASSRQVLDLLKETVRLTAQVAGLELEEGVAGRSRPSTSPASDRAELLRRARELELEVLDLQDAVAAANGGPAARDGFGPADYLRYRKLVGRLRDLARRELSPQSSVLVISKGDDELLDIGVEQAAHFPQDERGGYAGHYPESSAAAIAELEELRGKGAQYLLVPVMASWWLDRYPELGEHLRNRCRLVAEDAEAGSLFELAPAAGPSA
jgi:GT2 family glycosyltransferase